MAIMETEEMSQQTHGHHHPGQDQAEQLQDKVPAEDSDTDEGLGGTVVGKSKSSKTRRARRKAFKPYYQLSEGERGIREEREKLRVAKLKERMWAKGRIIAPYNTTQFLMGDQDDIYYSSAPANDQDFLSNEFKKEYEVHNINRLERMSKEMLLNEYMLLERKNEVLEEKLKTVQDKEEYSAVEVGSDPQLEFATNRMLKLQAELEKIKMENQRLQAENFEMKRRLGDESETADSSDTDCSTSSSSDGDIEDNKQSEQVEALQTSDDPGYESNQSKGEIK